MDNLITSDKLAVLALRDPVHPSGGMTEDERKTRVQNNPLTKYLSAHDGGYKYTVGKEEKKKREYTYNTKDHLFVGKDISPSLLKNVELGIYRMFVCLGTEDQKTLGKQLKDVLEKKGVEQEKAVMPIVKWFQYPQLMISGSLSVRNVLEKIKMA